MITTQLKTFRVMIWGLEDYLYDIIKYLEKNSEFKIKRFNHSIVSQLYTEQGFYYKKAIKNLKKQLKEFYNELLIINMDLPQVENFLYFPSGNLPKRNEEFVIFIEKKTKEIKKEFHNVHFQINVLRNKELILKKYRNTIKKIKPIVEELAKHSYKDYDVFFIDKTSFRIETIIERIKEICSDELEIYEEPIDDKVIALIILEDDITKIHNFFKEERVTNAMELPEDYEDVSVHHTFLDIHEHLDTIESSLTSLYKNLNSLAIEYKGFLEVVIPELEERIAILEKIDGNIYISNFVFFMTGILSTSDINEFRIRLNEQFDSKVNLISEPVSIIAGKD